MAKQEIHIRLKVVNHRTLDQYTKRIDNLDTAVLRLSDRFPFRKII